MECPNCAGKIRDTARYCNRCGQQLGSASESMLSSSTHEYISRPEQLVSGIVRILDANENIAGAGFVVSASGLIATCAHVIGPKALQSDGERHPEKVTIVFHATGDKQDARIEGDWWLPPDAGDLAILRVEGILPQGVQPLPLGSAEGTSGHDICTFGFPYTGDIEGIGGDGKVVRGLTRAGRSIIQLRSSEITGGFSGAPIWDKLRRRVIGMVSDITKPDSHHRLVETAFAITTETLRSVCPVLQISEVCPYRGLAAFREADAEFFFGRQQVIDGLLNRLRREPRFLTVLGPSGSGKSSLVQAGFIPQLRNGRLLGSDHWGVIVTRPADNPFDELTKQGLPDGSPSLDERVRSWLSKNPEQERLVLIFDQFEELFVICPEALRQDFVGQLTQLLHAPLPISAILVLRDDFYSRLTQHEALVEWLEHTRGPIHVPQTLKRDELTALVQKPAEAVGLRFEDGLVDVIVKDTMEAAVEAEDAGQAGRSSVLPLLEFALSELWKRRQEGMLTHRAYEQIGGVTGSLTQWADQAYYSLEERQRQLARSLFTALVHISDDAQQVSDTRRRRELTLLMRNEAERTEMDEVVQRLVAARLLVMSQDIESKQETIEIIHDALLWEWGLLKRWVEEDRRFLLWHQELEQRTRAWIDTSTNDPTKRDVYKLFGGSDLTEALDWMKMRAQELSQSEHEFIQASQKQQKKILTRRKFIGIVILGVTGGGFALGRLLLPPTPSLPQSHPSPPFILSGHTAVVTSVAWSPNNRWLATSSEDNTARLWSASSGELLHIFSGHTQFVLSVVWSSNSQWLATASFDSTARIWSASTGKLFHILSGHGNAVSSVAWSPNGRWLATSGYDWTARIWEVSTGKLLHILKHMRSVSGITWSPDGQWLATSSDDGIVRIWNAAGLLLRELSGSTDNIPIGRMAWSPNSQWLAIASDDTAYVWNAITGTILQIPGGQTHSVTRVAWSPDSQWLATSDSRENSTHLWDIITGRSGPTFKEHTDSITQIAWSPNSQWLAIASQDKTALIADATTGESLYLFRGHQNAVNTIAWSPNGQWLATSSDDHTARVWEPFPDPLLRYTDHTGPVSGVTWSPSGQWVATYSEDTTARIWDAVSGQALHIFNGHKHTFTNIVWSPNGLLIATSSEDGTAHIWDAVSGQTLHILNSHQASMDNITWSPGGQWIATYSSDGNLNSTPYIWDAASGRLLHVLNDHPPFTTITAWSPNGQWLATSSEDGTARVWDASSGQLLHILSGHTSTVFSVAWSPNGQWLASGSVDSTARIWNASTGEPIFILRGHTKMIRCVAWSPNGQWLATCSDDGTVRIWDVLSGQTLYILKNPMASVKSVNGVMNVAWSPNGQWLASSHRDGSAWIWNTSTGRPFHVLRGHTNTVNNVVWSPTGQRLATSSADSTACIWFLAGSDKAS